MQIRRAAPVIAWLCFAAAGHAQNVGLPEAPAAPSNTVIRTEKRLVLVDAIVTDKKGNYINDLSLKDFRVWEDKKEVPVESFSFEADPKSPQVRKHYAVLFFDNSTMSPPQQIYARQAAQKFLDTNTGPNRLMAVVNFGGSLQIAQNFTDDVQRLKQVVSGIKFSSVSPNGDIASTAGAQLSAAAAQFGARDVLLAVRTLAKGLRDVPGRKTLIFLSTGFALDDEIRSELTAVIDVCNKSNVAVYPIDVRGLVTGLGSLIPPELYYGGHLERAAFVQQRGGPGTITPGGGARTGGGRMGGGNNTAGGMPSGNRGNPGMSPYGMNGRNGNRGIVPPVLPNVSQNQEVLYALASGTGGFVIVNTNDLLGGLEKIGNEQNQYYILGYTPPDDDAGGECHQLKVKVERGGTNVRARSGYCTPKPQDLLAGTRTEKELETRAQAGAAGNVSASMLLPFFYTSANTARVDVALEIPPGTLKFAKEKGKLHSEMNVLGIATEADGTVAARFSDTVKLDFDDKKQLKDFEQHPYHYENQFDLASGRYTFKVAFSSGGESFGKLQMPLAVDAYDTKTFGVSGIALSKSFHKVSDVTLGLDTALLEDRKPLVCEGVELTPSGSNVFDKTQPAGVYLEIYEPLLKDPNAPKIGLQLKIIDRKTGQQKLDTGFINAGSHAKAGNPVVPVAMKLPVETLSAGSYRAEFKAADSAGNYSVVRSADFEVQ